jgi:hypothetical protein
LRRLLVISKFESSELWIWFAIESPWLRFAAVVAPLDATKIGARGEWDRSVADGAQSIFTDNPNLTAYRKLG